VVSNGAKPSLGQWKADVEALLSLARAGETEKARERLQAIVGNSSTMSHFRSEREGAREQGSRGEGSRGQREGEQGGGEQ